MRRANYVPLVDTKGRDAAQLSADTRECQAFAHQRMNAADGAAVGVAAGAVFGALLMAAVGGSSRDGAWVGALSGGARGAIGANESQENIVKRCLAGRGYNVLN